MIDIPGYKIVRTLGKGGMASVYLAVQETFEREVALKVMNPALAQDAQFTARFLHEARIVSRLVHPNIVTVYDVGVQGSYHYLSMEYVPGVDLKHKRRFLNPPQCLQVVREVAKALEYAGKKGYVHRDVKPENIMLHEDNGRAVLMDFGIACLADSRSGMTQTGIAIGTPHYMSPEQAKGQTVDTRSDIYSLGVVLYLLLTGRVPFDGDSAVAVGIQHVQEPVPRLPGYLLVLQPIIAKALAKDPKERYQNAGELIAAIDAVTDEDIEAIQLAAKHYESQVQSGKLTPPAPREPKPISKQISKQERHAIEATMATVSFDREAILDEEPDGRAEGESNHSHTSSSKAPWAWAAAALLVAVLGSALVFRDNYREQLPPVAEAADTAVLQMASFGSELNGLWDSARTRFARPESNIDEVEIEVEDSIGQTDQPQTLNGPRQVNTAEIGKTEHLLEQTTRDLRERLDGDLSLAPRLAELFRNAEASSLEDGKAREGLQELLDYHYEHIAQAQEAGDLKQAERYWQSLRSSFPELGTGEEGERYRQLEDDYAVARAVEQHLQEAQAFVAEGALAEPDGGNARDAYQQVLELQPNHQQAEAGLKEIANRYADMAQAKLEAGESAEALQLATLGLTARDDHRGLQQVRSSAQAQLSRRQELQELQRRAEQQMAAENFVVPRGDSAYDHLRRVLELDPGNQQALRQIADIERELVRRAETHINRNQFDQARSLLVAARDSFGQSERLDSLARALEQALEADYTARQPHIREMMASDAPMDRLSQGQREVLQVERTLHIGFSYQNFQARTSVVQAMLYDASRGRQIAQVPVIVSGREGSKHFQIERPVEGFSEGRYELDLFLNDERLGSLSFRVGREGDSVSVVDNARR